MLIASLSSAAATPSGLPEHFCDKPIKAHGYTYGIQGSGVRCPFMRKWAMEYLNHRREIPHWDCYSDYEGGQCHRVHVKPPKPYFLWYIFD